MIQLEQIMFFMLLAVTLISAFITFRHIFMQHHSRAYDNWLFPVTLAMCLQVYENIF